MEAFRHHRGRQPFVHERRPRRAEGVVLDDVIRFVRHQAERRLERRAHDGARGPGFGIRRAQSLDRIAGVGRRCEEEERNPAGVADVERAQCERVPTSMTSPSREAFSAANDPGRTFKMKRGVSITCEFEAMDEVPRIGCHTVAHRRQRGGERRAKRANSLAWRNVTPTMNRDRPKVNVS